MTPAIERPLTLREVCIHLRLGRDQLRKLVHSGQVGYVRIANNGWGFLPDHIAQIRDAIEVKPRPATAEPLIVPGMSPRSAALRRRRAG